MKYIAKVNGKTYEVEVERAAGAYAPIPRSVYTEEGKTAAPAPAAPIPSPAPVTSAATPVNSPMPGTVFKIIARPGQSVKAGEVLLILEAMKMEIEVAAPEAGTVTAIAVSEGNPVTTDQLLVTLG